MIEVYYLWFHLSKYVLHMLVEVMCTQEQVIKSFFLCKQESIVILNIKTNSFVHNKQIPYGTFVSSAEMIEYEERWRIKIDNEEIIE